MLYKTCNTFERREESLVDFDIVLANALHLLKQGEQILIFLPSKREAMAFAYTLAENANLPKAENTLKEPSILEDTSLKEALTHCLESSVALTFPGRRGR